MQTSATFADVCMAGIYIYIIYGVYLCVQVINWLCTEGEDHLRRHVTVADNLRGIQAQQVEFTKFRSVAEVGI